MTKEQKNKKVENVEDKQPKGPMLLFESVFHFGGKGAKTKKGVAENIVAYYEKQGVKTTEGLKRAFKGKVNPMNVEYINKFIDTVTVDFNKPTGWRNDFEVFSDKNTWKIQEKPKAA